MREQHAVGCRSVRRNAQGLTGFDGILGSQFLMSHLVASFPCGVCGQERGHPRRAGGTGGGTDEPAAWPCEAYCVSLGSVQ